MRLAAATLHPYALPLTRPWVAAAATLHVRRGVLLRLTDADGHAGWGDCAPLPSRGEAGQAEVFAALRAVAGRLAGQTAEAALAHADPAVPPEVRWAIETAVHDLLARRAGRPLAELLGAAPGQGVAVNAALGALDAGCTERALAALAAGYRIAKIKVGVDAPEAELARLHALDAAVGGRLRLRLDANRAWPGADARRFLAALAPLPIDAVEEPLAAPTLAALGALQAALPFPIAIDESLPQFGADAILASAAVRRLVVKPARLGGIAATQALAQQARAAGIELVLTSVVDSAVGVTAVAHLAAALAPDRAHGLATGDWLAADVAPALAIAAGHWTPAPAPGLGITPVDIA